MNKLIDLDKTAKVAELIVKVIMGLYYFIELIKMVS